MPLNNHQNGNVFVLVFLGVVLFAALMFAVSRGLNTSSRSMNQAQARNYAIDIISYGQKVERAVARVLAKGVSENDISFENDVVSGYEHTPAAPAAGLIFNRADGLGVIWQDPIAKTTYEGDNQWVFSGDFITLNLGDDARSELMMGLLVRREVCAEINKQLGVTTDLDTPIGTPITITKFIGTFADNVTNTFASDVVAEGCYRASVTEGTQSGAYIYGKVLLAR